MRLKHRSYRALAASAVFAALMVSASAQDINGGNSWAGWNSVGNSQTSGMWVQGSTTRTYDIYSTSFVLSADQTVGGTRIAGYSAPFTPYAAGDGVGYTGDLADSLFSGVWQAGDRIVGMGIQYTGSTRGSTFFFHRDAGGNNIAGASSFGASDGVSTFDVGDSVSYMTTIAGNPRGQVRHYQIWNGFSQNGTPPEGNFTAPYSWNHGGPTPFPEFPTRTFAVLENGSMDLVKSVQYFVNYDAILRSNGGLTFGDGDFGPNTRFGFWEGDQTTGQTGFSQQIFAIPTPGAFQVLSGCFNNPATLSALSPALTLGQNAVFEVEDQSGSPGVALLYRGLPGVTGSACGLLVPGIGEVLLASQPLPTLLASSPAPVGVGSFTVPVPLAPQLVGVQIGFQGVFIPPSPPGATLTLSNALLGTFAL